MERSILLRKLALLLLILLALWMLNDDDFSVWNALGRHEPSARIFRSLLEINLLLFGTAFSIHIWSKTVGRHMVRQLLFQPVEESTPGGGDVGGALRVEQYDDTLEERPSLTDDSNNSDNDQEGMHARRHRVGSFDHEHADADYDSEGEVLAGATRVPTSPSDDRASNDGSEPHPRTAGVPSAESVLGAALDTLLAILVMLFLFSLAASGWFRETSDESPNTPMILSRIAAPIFPLVLFVYLAIKLVFPWKAKRREFWVVLSLTLGAPLFEVTFRDGFVGDILTSSVRPLQDIAFTVVYLFYGLRGWWSQSYFEQDDNSNDSSPSQNNITSSFSRSFVDNADANVPVMEKSWLLHTILLPLCMISPLWWRFLQNLRQTHDARQRWPYLGNALKYFCAAQVAVFGVFYPASHQSVLWLMSFVFATLYQIWWDVYMDWGLLQSNGRLRTERLYRSTAAYWTIAAVNVVLRFGWTLSFVPRRYLNATGVLTNNFAGDVSAVLSPFLASAEIIRRTLWGLLRFEFEAIKVGGTSLVSEEDSPVERKSKQGEEEDGVELVPMKVQGDSRSHVFPSMDTRISTSLSMSSMSRAHILVELCTYATVFAAIGIVAAAHRGTL